MHTRAQIDICTGEFSVYVFDIIFAYLRKQGKLLLLLPNSLWFCHFLSSLLSFFIISLRPLFVVIFADIMPTYGKRHREIYYALY